MSIVEKIRKLLELSQSSNPHEAALALEKANKLMEEHQIAMNDLKIVSQVTHSGLETITAQHFIWAKGLAYSCAKLFDCTTISYSGECAIRFIGEPENILCANQLFNHLFEAWKTMCNIDYVIDKPRDRKLYRKSHGIGFSSMIWQRVQELTEKRHNNIVKATGTDLVVVSDAKLSEYIQSNFKTHKPKARSLTTSSSGFSKGSEAGKKVNLVAPIGKQKNELITSTN